MIVLALTLAALVVPPFFAEGFRRRPGVAAFLDGFVLVAIGALVLGDVLPTAFGAAGWTALAAALVGLAVPTFAERMGLQGRVVHGAGVVVGQFALLAHAAFDGVALGTAEAAGPAIAAAVVLHQVPVGVSAWLSMRARLGVRAAVTALGAMSLATIAGYFLGGAALASSPRVLVGVLAGLSAGTLLHVVGHARLPGADDDPREHGAEGAVAPSATPPPGRPWRWSGVGGSVALAGLAASHAVPWLLGAEESHAHDIEGVVVDGLGSVAGPYLVGTLLAIGLPRTGWLRAVPLAPLALVTALVGPAAGLAFCVGALVAGVTRGAVTRDGESNPRGPADAALVLGVGLAAAVMSSDVRFEGLPLALHIAVGLVLVQVPLPLVTLAVLAGALARVGVSPTVLVVSLLGSLAWPGGLRRHLRGTPRDVRTAILGGGGAAIAGILLVAVLPPSWSGPVALDPRVSVLGGTLLGVWLLARLLARGPRGWIADVLGTHEHPPHGDPHHAHVHAAPSDAVATLEKSP